jgi:hypothetical protein
MNMPEGRMEPTQEYKETVLTRLKRDPKFARALFAESVNALLEGETEEGLSIPRDLVTPALLSKNLPIKLVSAKKRYIAC